MATRQYIGARYVTKIYVNSQDPSSAEWEASVNYEPLTMVTYNDGSYLSRKEVPATVGDPAANPQYWAQTGFYNGQIASLQSQITAIGGRVSDNEDDIDILQGDTIATGIRTKMLCHRGLTGYSPFAQDNSAFAFIQAAEHGFNGYECDIRKDVNGVPVMLHDATVDSVSTTTGNIVDLDYTNVIYKATTGESAGKHLTSLEEAINISKTYNMFMMFDLGKNTITCAEVAAICERCGYNNYGVFGVSDIQDLKDLPDYAVKIVEESGFTYTESQLNGYLATLDGVKNIGVRINYPSTDEQISLIKSKGFLIMANFTTQFGDETNDNVGMIDFMLGDYNIVNKNYDFAIGNTMIASTMDIKDYADQLPQNVECDVQLAAGSYTPTNDNYLCHISKYSNNYIKITAHTFDDSTRRPYQLLKLGGTWGNWKPDLEPTEIIINETEQTYNITINAAYKNGICCVNLLRESGTDSSSGWTTIGTIPDGYRPAIMVNIRISVATYEYVFRILTDGQIQIYSIPPTQINACLTFPVA